MKVLVVILALSFIPAASAQEYPELGVMVDTVAENLLVPWSIDWLPDGTILFTERGGDLRAIRDGMLVPEPLVSVHGSSAEGGMLGVAVDPDFEENGYIYIYYTYSELYGLRSVPKISLLTLLDHSSLWITRSAILHEAVRDGTPAQRAGKASGQRTGIRDRGDAHQEEHTFGVGD